MYLLLEAVNKGLQVFCSNQSCDSTWSLSSNIDHVYIYITLHFTFTAFEQKPAAKQDLCPALFYTTFEIYYSELINLFVVMILIVVENMLLLV